MQVRMSEVVLGRCMVTKRDSLDKILGVMADISRYPG